MVTRRSIIYRIAREVFKMVVQHSAWDARRVRRSSTACPAVEAAAVVGAHQKFGDEIEGAKKEGGEGGDCRSRAQGGKSI